jgi:hypothetical protein
MDEQIDNSRSEVSELDEAAARRARRAREEEMTVSLRQTGGIYDVHSESGHTYRVDIAGEECSCPDWQEREPEGGCKHLRRVRLAVRAGQVPTPDGRLPDERCASDEQPVRAAADGGRVSGITGPHIEFDKHGEPTGATYYRCESCGREAIQRKDLGHHGGFNES